MAENLTERGVEVTVVEMLDQVIAGLDYEMAAMLHRHLQDNGVRLNLGDGLKEILAVEGGRRMKAILSSGKAIEGDMVILAIGVRPESDLAAQAGLALGPRRHIVVDQYMRTSDPDIYAVGDVVHVMNPITEAMTAVPLAGPANRQARIAADHITGLEHPYEGTMGTAIVKIFELTAACVGPNSKTLRAQGIEFVTSITHSQDHVAYYPGATPQTIKLLYSPASGRLLGAQVIGYKAVDRTVDVLATALKAGMTVYDLEQLELAYAPPYGAAKDPVNIAGYTAANHLRGETELIAWHEIPDLDMDAYGLLDVRTFIEYDLGHVPGSINIPNTELRERLGELSEDKAWVLVCDIGRRAYVMERMLKQRGYRTCNLTGGWHTFRAATEAQDGDDTHIRVRQGGQDTVASTERGLKAVVDRKKMTLDACGLSCPGPILAVYNKMQELGEGELLEVLATDPGFGRDIGAWTERTGNTLIETRRENGVTTALIQKGGVQPEAELIGRQSLANAKTMIVFSADLDRAIAAFVIANGAAAMGQRVTMFFTFWGLNILRRKDPKPIKKNLIERMFGWMLPKGVDALKLSRMNMGGLGTLMMKGVMKSKNIDPLPEMMRTAKNNGVKLIACQMTMDLMGIKAEEFVDGVEIGGVATYLNETDKANATLFI
jgi:peroxiredoxin family protein/TusA-related sulfurtransferase/rhodanese-related sulfurtransferase